MTENTPPVAVWRRFFGQGAPRHDPYGQWYVDKAYVAAEVELDIGLVTVALILIYRQDVWLALGTLAGFLILEFLMMLAAISMAENTIRLRRRVDLLLEHQGLWEALVELGAEEASDDEDPYKLLRVVVISAAVTGAIVAARTWF